MSRPSAGSPESEVPLPRWLEPFANENRNGKLEADLPQPLGPLPATCRVGGFLSPWRAQRETSAPGHQQASMAWTSCRSQCWEPGLLSRSLLGLAPRAACAPLKAHSAGWGLLTVTLIFPTAAPSAEIFSQPLRTPTLPALARRQGPQPPNGLFVYSTTRACCRGLCCVLPCSPGL